MSWPLVYPFPSRLPSLLTSRIWRRHATDLQSPAAFTPLPGALDQLAPAVLDQTG